jgi:hypothetical protein
MQIGVKHQTRSVEEFVRKRVPIERLILEQGWMQADGDLPGVKAKTTATDEFIAPFLKPSHAQAVVVHVQPFNHKAVGDPRPKNGFDMTGQRRKNGVDHVFGNAGRLSGHRRVGEWPTLFFAHGPATKHPLQEA